MVIYLQIFKDLFLIFTTLFIVYWFLKDYHIGLNLYLLLFAVIALLGLDRVIYFERIVIPILLVIGLTVKYSRLDKINNLYLILFIFMLLNTYLNGLTLFDKSSDGIYLMGFSLLIFANYLFKKNTNAIHVVFFIWLILIGYLLNYILLSGNIFSIGKINLDERMVILDTGIVNGSGSGMDLNYFGCGQAIGAVITFIFIYYRKYLLSIICIPSFLKNIFSSLFILIVLYLLLFIQIWLVLKGLSRGGLLVLLSGLFSFLIIQKKYKYLAFGGIILLLGYFIMIKIGIVDLLVQRMTNDASGTSGRNLIWLGIINSVQAKGGVLQLILGCGNGWPWWKYWSENSVGGGTIVSTHNQWMSLLVSVGLIGLILFFIPIINGIRDCIKNNNPINEIRIILFVCVFIESMSLEPFVFARYVWFLLALVTTYTPNIKKISRY